MNNLIIRNFDSKDRADIVELFFEFGKYYAELDEKYLNLVIIPKNYGESFYRNMIEDVVKKKGIIFVLEDGQKVVGFIAGIIIEVGNDEDEIDCKPHKMGRVIKLFISKDYRGQRYGTLLINKMKEYFKQRQCYKINIEVFGPNEEAHNFYKKLGFVDRNIDLVQVI